MKAFHFAESPGALTANSTDPYAATFASVGTSANILGPQSPTWELSVAEVWN